MKFSTGLFDWLFGEKITIELPDGQKRIVTKRWWEEMQGQGNVKPLPAKGSGKRMEISPKAMFQHADYISMISIKAIEEHFPAFQHILARDGLDNWSLCFATAFGYTAVREQPDELSDREFVDFRNAVRDFVPQWQDNGVEAFNNLNGFINMSDQIPYHTALGMWVLWNLGGNRPTQLDELTLARALGAYIKAHVAEWWKLARC